MKYDRIRALREEKGLNQSQMGEILHCSQRVYSNYERGESNIPTDILVAIADYHGVSLDYLVGRKEKAAAGPDGGTDRK